jgi:hypothetical protein
VPLCQHADHALDTDTDTTVVSLKLRRIFTELRRHQRAKFAKFIKWQFRIEQIQLFW